MARSKGDLSESEKKLYDCINNGETEEALKIIKNGDIRIDTLDENGMTPLHHAAYKANAKIVRALIRKKANVNNNDHDHSYTPLMFAALAGSKELCQILLENGAKPGLYNSVNRTATQMAAFVGQHQVVSLINNFFPKDDLEYYTKPHALETEPRLPPQFCNPLYDIILNNNLSPVKISLMIQKTPEFIDESKKLCKFLDFLVEKVMKQKETNEVMAIKFHYLRHILQAASQSAGENKGSLGPWLKRLLRMRQKDMCQEDVERFIRASLKDFPYIESTLLQQMVRQLAKTEIGSDPTAVSIVTSVINGERMPPEDDYPCSCCGDYGAAKKCSACKMVHYCSKDCQKLHWFTHKVFCEKLAEKFVQIQEWKKKQAEEEQKRQEEEKMKKEEEEKEKLESLENDETLEVEVSDDKPTEEKPNDSKPKEKPATEVSETETDRSSGDATNVNATKENEETGRPLSSEDILLESNEP